MIEFFQLFGRKVGELSTMNVVLLGSARFESTHSAMGGVLLVCAQTAPLGTESKRPKGISMTVAAVRNRMTGAFAEKVVTLIPRDRRQKTISIHHSA